MTTISPKNITQLSWMGLLKPLDFDLIFWDEMRSKYQGLLIAIAGVPFVWWGLKVDATTDC